MSLLSVTTRKSLSVVILGFLSAPAMASLDNAILTVSKSTGGSVISSPQGISCGASCAAPFDMGATVTLTAAPLTGYTFTGWGGDCAGISACTVTLDQAKTVTAHFAPLFSGGLYHSHAVRNGDLWSWGDNADGQLGNPVYMSGNVPVEVPGVGKILTVDAGWYHSLALKPDGRVTSWGYNAQGQLGIGDDPYNTGPATVQGLDHVVSIAAGGGSIHRLEIRRHGLGVGV